MNSLRLSRLVFPSLVRAWLVFGLFGLFGLFNFTPALRAQQLPPAREPQTQSSQNTLQRASSKRSPIFFVQNVGQFADARVKFQAQLGSSILTVRNKSLILSVLESLPKRQHKPNTAPPKRQGVNLNLKFVGAKKKIKIVPFRRIDTRMSFYLGDNPDTWRTDVPVWEGVRLKNIYPKIDLILTSNAGRFTPRLVARKGADVSQVKLRIQGAQELELAKNGIRVKTQVRAFTLPFFRVVHKANPNQKLPQASVDGDVVTAPFTIKAASKESNAELDDDTVYQTLFGGGVLDVGTDIAVDSAGNAYVAGSRYSADFDSDGFVVKLDATGTVVQTTIFGGAESDDASGIVVDAEGNAFVSGSTFSSDFAGGGNPYDYDGFVAKVNTAGELDWAQRLGGTDLDFANGLAWNGASLLVGGSSSSSNWGASSQGSGYLIELDVNGGIGAPEFLNLGAEGTYISGVTVGNGAVWVTGASSTDGNAQGFVQNHSSGQTETFGGSGNDSPADLVVDAQGNAYVIGSTDSTDWAGFHPGECIGPEIARESALPCHDVFMVRLGADSALTTQLFGGSGDDWGNGIAVNAQGEVLVVGDNGSGDWLTPNYGNGDGFILQLNSSLTPTWTRVIGGSSFDGAGGIAVDESGAMYVAGNLSDGEDVSAYAMKLLASVQLWPRPTAPDATGSGPFGVTSAEYKRERGINQDILPARETELWARVWWPTDLSSGPFPLVVFLHGNHATCGQGENPRFDDRSDYSLYGECPPGWVVVPNHMGYSYLAEQLASWGYVVVSINANLGINASAGLVDDPALINARGRLVLKHLERWSEWNTVGAADPGLGVGGNGFVGKIDFTNVGLFGHSRGGEGMRAAYNLYREAGSPWQTRIPELSVNGIFEIGPTDSFGALNADGTAWNVLLPMCDGDVADMSGVRPFDRMMVQERDENPTTPKSVYMVWGANHNFYNTEWQISDSSRCLGIGNETLFPLLMGSPEQRTTGLASVSAFFRANVGAQREPSFNLNFNPLADLPPAVSSITRVERGYTDSPASSVTEILEDFDQPWGVNSSGTLNDASDLTGSHGIGFLPEHDSILPAGIITWASSGNGTYYQMNWEPEGFGRSITEFTTLDIRIARFLPHIPDEPTTLSVQLVHADGTLSRTISLAQNNPLFGPIGTSSPLWGDRFHWLLQTARIPLGDLDTALNDVRGVRAVFDQTPSGTIYITNVRLSRQPLPQ